VNVADGKNLEVGRDRARQDESLTIDNRGHTRRALPNGVNIAQRQAPALG
jgi:hypothetical protein